MKITLEKLTVEDEGELILHIEKLGFILKHNPFENVKVGGIPVNQMLNNIQKKGVQEEE